MREAVFIKLNYQRWQTFEDMVGTGKAANPDQLADLFVQVTDDLAFAQTQYPQSQTTQYLNSLASKIHQAIYINKKEQSSRFITFWKIELPREIRSAQKELLYAALIFGVAVCIGALSAAYDDTFVRLILSDAYVNQTLANIENGDPMAIYKSMGSTDMFFAITFNNIYVSMLTFLWGGINGFPLFIFVSFGTGLSLLYNGIMLGAFQYFFYQQDLLLTSVLTIWIHGTLEIASIIIAGAAGLVMGNSLLFPATYTRLESFKRGAKRGLKIVVGLVPIFITAGFLESFVTRHTEWPSAVKATIVLLSLLFLGYYFIYYPRKISN